MQLSFLGQSYETALPTVEATETATFLGKSYARKQYAVSQRHQPASELTYRGVSYSR